MSLKIINLSVVAIQRFLSPINIYSIDMSEVVEKDKVKERNIPLQSFLSRFVNKVLDRDPTLTRDKAMSLFKQALTESDGPTHQKGGSGSFEDKLLIQIHEMIDAIQTDFLFSLSVSKRIPKVNFPTLMYCFFPPRYYNN